MGFKNGLKKCTPPAMSPHLLQQQRHKPQPCAQSEQISFDIRPILKTNTRAASVLHTKKQHISRGTSRNCAVVMNSLDTQRLTGCTQDR